MMMSQDQEEQQSFSKTTIVLHVQAFSKNPKTKVLFYK